MKYEILLGDALEQLRTLEDESVHCCVTSPPYFNLRDYAVEGQIGLEATPDEFIERLAGVFKEVQRVLRNDGTLWLNIADSQNKKKLLGIPWRLAFALQDSGWFWRDTIAWHKPNPMPESVKDRCTKSLSPVFMLAKKPHYYYGFEEMQEPATCAGQSRGGSRNRYEQNSGNLNGNQYDTRNMRNVWEIIPENTPGKKHYAAFPEELARRCIRKNFISNSWLVALKAIRCLTLSLAVERRSSSL